MKELWLLALLYGQARRDGKTRELSAKLLLIQYLAGIPFFFHRLWETGISSAGSLLPGILLAGISFLSGGSLGLGDALVLFGMGLYLDEERLWLSFLLGMGGSGVWAALLYLKNRRRKEEIPFIPFLLAGYVGGLALWSG